jgi:Flp pilus assembly protein TadD
MDQAKAAAKDTQYGKALRLCRAALGKRPGDQEATMVCAIAACNLNNEVAAKKYVRRIKSAQRKSMARQICLKHNITDIE